MEPHLLLMVRENRGTCGFVGHALTASWGERNFEAASRFYRESFPGRKASHQYKTAGNLLRQSPYQKEEELWHGNTSIAATTPAK